MNLRVSAVQYPLKTLASFQEFSEIVVHYVKTAKEFASEVVLFPEFLTTQFLSFRELMQNNSIDQLPGYTKRYVELFSLLAKEYNLHIIAGTHVTKRDEKLYNTAYLFYPDGTYQTQDKIHITPTEKHDWNIQAGESFSLFHIKEIPVAILTCYDMEFPELARIAREQGAEIFFCPSCTDDRHGFYRVRYSSHARAIENQVYIVGTGTIGSLPTVDYMRANIGQASILSPNDIGFPPGGVIDEGIMNQDMMITGDLNMEVLRKSRTNGSVSTWQDRRKEFYKREGKK